MEKKNPELRLRDKNILEKYRTLRAKKIKQYDALDIIRGEQAQPLQYETILHIITEAKKDEREQLSRSEQIPK